VADFMVPLALGTQTGGSTIRPAAYCGIYAMKPTHNVVSAEGVKVYARTLDTVGWYGRSVADLALVAEAYGLLNGEPVPSRPAEDLRVAICRPPHAERAKPGTLAVLEQAAERLGEAGVRIDRRDLPPEFDRLNDAKETIMRGEARATFLPEYRAHYPILHEGLRGHVENRTGITRERLKQALDFAAACRVSFDAAFAGCDGVLTVSARGEADEGHVNLGDPIFISLWTTLHLPAINLPGMVGPNGLPVGLQLVGRRYMDAELLAVAAMIAAHIDPQAAMAHIG
jgi:Asp-tRNA(Asn)/Glu-tRNA(Gln) amidotransferase A subunit family amidase